MAKVDSNEPVTRGVLDEAVKAILNGMDELINGLKGEMVTIGMLQTQQFINMLTTFTGTITT